MSTALATFLTQVNLLINADNDEFAEASRQAEIKHAVETYSGDKPLETSADVTGDGGHFYPLTGAGAVLTSWSDGFSRVVSIEYPAAVVASNESPVMLEPKDWDDDYWAGGVRYLHLPNHSPAATEKARVRYTAPYVWASSATETPAGDFYAICCLAAAYCCQAIAARYSRTSESSLSADSVNHRSRGDMFASRAKEFEKAYRSQVGERGRGDALFVDWDTAPGGLSGRQYLYHRGR